MVTAQEIHAGIFYNSRNVGGNLPIRQSCHQNIATIEIKSGGPRDFGVDLIGRTIVSLSRVGTSNIMEHCTPFSRDGDLPISN